MYASNDWKPWISPDRLQKWVRLHADNRSFIRLQDVDRYYREFTAQATPLTTATRITANEANLLFYRGIPSSMRKKIKRKIPAAQQTSTAAPLITNILALLRAQFSEDDIDNDDDDVELTLDSDKDYDASDTEEELEPPSRSQQKHKKKVKFDVKEVPGALPVQPPVPPAIDSLAKQMEDLQLNQARQMEDLRHGQATLLRELSAVKSMNGNRINPSSNSNMHMNVNANAPVNNTSRCFICDTFDLHGLGICNCQEVERLIEEGLVKYTPSGRLVRPDGSELP
jgi:hypothetical protein